MCGIFAVGATQVPCKMQDIVHMLVSGLRRVEYRGYDSAGLCVVDDKGAHIVKRAGNVQTLHDAIFASKDHAGLDLEAQVGSPPHSVDDGDAAPGRTAVTGIAHTRWATHGPPSDRNAHPHSSDETGAFVCVHNGIMTNFDETKKFLATKGDQYKKYTSDTDTEVIAKLALYLFEEHQRQHERVSLAALAVELMALVHGANAFILVSRHYPGEMVAAKRGSPMICGFSQGPIPTAAASAAPPSPGRAGTLPSPIAVPDVPSPQSVRMTDHARALAGQGVLNLEGPSYVYFASDPASLAAHTRHVVYLDDEDVVHFTPTSLKFFNAKNSQGSMLESVDEQTVGRTVSRLEMALEDIGKGQYAHFMLKEINEQVHSVVNSMRGRLNFSDGRIMMGGFADPARVRTLLSARRIMFIAAGTSLNACIAVRPLFDELAGCPTVIENASDFLDRAPRVFRDDVCIFVSQSGETADSLRCLEWCRDAGATLIGFTNVVGSSISRTTHYGAHLNCGPEIGVASTKAFTSQIVVMTLLALMLCEDSRAQQARRAAIIQGLNTLSANIGVALKETEPVIRRIAERLVNAKSVLVLGRGYQYATCLEAALKIKELTYIHTEGLNAGELKHGPLALIDENIPVIVICTRDALAERSRAAVQQIKARNGRPIVVLSEPDPEVEALAEEIIRVPATVDCLQVLVNTVPLQLLAYHLAVLRGNNVDCPRNLAKSVTVQ